MLRETVSSQVAGWAVLVELRQKSTTRVAISDPYPASTQLASQSHAGLHSVVAAKGRTT